MSRMRIDKWLWAVRIFKSRTISTDACKSNSVTINDSIVKPSTEVKIGDKVKVRKGPLELEIQVIMLLTKRVSAKEAKKCYLDRTSMEEYEKAKLINKQFRMEPGHSNGKGRPTKKQRRALDTFLFYDEIK